MSAKLDQLKQSKAGNFFYSFSPAARAALVFVVPFTLLDALHYYTAGTAMVVSLPFVGLAYLLCGMLAARYALREEGAAARPARVGAVSGALLWLASTLINTGIHMVIVGLGTAGVTMFLGGWYLCLCGPVHALLAGLLGAMGGWLYAFVSERANTPQE